MDYINARRVIINKTSAVAAYGVWATVISGGSRQSPDIDYIRL